MLVPVPMPLIIFLIPVHFYFCDNVAKRPVYSDGGFPVQGNESSIALH